MTQNIACQILLDQLKAAHSQLESTMEGVTNDVAAYQPAGTANPIAGTYAHLVMSEDMFIHSLLQGKKSLMDTTWKDITGADSLQPTDWQNEYPKWLRSVKIDITELRTYAKAVYEATEQYLTSLSDEDLMKDVDMSMFGMDKRPVHHIISSFVIGHARDICGEISVLKGIQGLKGYPY